MTDVLRPYQVDVVAQIEQAIAAGEKRLLIVAPTGSGKTVVASAIINRFTERYRPVVVLAHRKEIIDQTSKKLHGSKITRTASSKRATHRAPWSGCRSQACKLCGSAPCDRRR